MIPFKFYAVMTTVPRFNVDRQTFQGRNRSPILWDFKGMFRIIPLERVMNMIEALEDSENLSPIAKDKQVGTFYWEDGIDVNPKVAKILLSGQQ